MKLVIFIALLSMGACSYNQNSESIRHPASSDDVPYPVAQEGYKRVDVIVPYHKKKAQDLISIEVGLMTTNCNAIRVGAKMEEKNVEGWGSSYLVFTSNGEMLEDRVGCLPLTNPKFVPAGSVIYDSPEKYPAKSPYHKVLYVPEDFIVKVKYLKVFKEKKY